jgi:signal transduction histidine kinase
VTGSAAEVAEARAELRKQGATFPLEERSARELERAQPTLALVERFGTVLEAGRSIASALSRDAVILALREAANTLLPAERCRVIDVAGGGEIGPRSPTDARRSFEAGLARHAAMERSAVRLSRSSPTDIVEAALVAGVRSAIAAPVLVRGQVDVCLVASHDQVGGVFGDDEVRLAEFVTTLAGAALENAHGFHQVQALTRTLERRIREREEDIRARDDFLTTAAHELRTPVTSLHLSLQSLARMTRMQAGSTISAEVVAERADRAQRSETRLTKLIEELLDVSALSMGKLDLKPEIVDVGEVVRDAAARLAEQAQTVGSPLVIQAQGGVGGRWDRSRLDRIVTNLVSNAIKYGAGAMIEVSLRADARKVEIVVRDHGIGIAPEDQARIFERFTRAAGSDHQVGLGLGLWIVRQLAEAMGGDVQVESELGAGTTFTVTLPRRGPEQDEPARRPPLH